ncbi:MAG: translation initiation factor IF-2 associated domain-containing protein, partial [Sedimenticolaceae bacterium]
MSEVTVSQLASDVGIPVDRLLKQLSEAGVTKQSAEDKISEQEKMDLLNHLRRSHGKKEAAGGTGVRKIALKRKTTTELHQPASGRPTARSAAVRAAKTVSVEVRRKRAVTRPLGDEEAKKQELLREAEEAKRALAEQAE